MFLLFFLYGAWGGIILFERFIKRDDIKHLQAVAILIGFGIFLTLIGLIYVFLPLITGTNKYLWLGPLTSLLLVGFAALVLTDFLKTKLVWISSLIIVTGIGLLVLLFLTPGLNLKILTTAIFLLFCTVGCCLIKATYKELQTKKETEKLIRESKELAKAKDQFILSLQHHLRTPLVPIKGYLEAILEGVYGREENPVIRKKLIETKKMADALYSLIESLLDIYEIKMEKKVLNLEKCKIESLIKGIVEELKPEAERKGLYLKFEPEKKLPEIKLDRLKMREAIWNIVDNAIKYTTRGGVTITAKIEGRKLKIGVFDTGIGMEKEEIERFSKGILFERGEEAKKMYGPGRGIGLSIAEEFVRAHGGRILIKSEGRGKGTTFFIELPIIN